MADQEIHYYHLLLLIGFVLIVSKLLSIASTKLKIPQVVGMLLSGILIGCFKYIPNENNLLTQGNLDRVQFLAEIGVVLIMFNAGLKTDLSLIKKTGIASVVITLAGLILPMSLGTVVSGVFNGFSGNNEFIEHRIIKKIYSDLFYGVDLTATSVGVTVATLKEINSLTSVAGTSVLSAAILDDIVGFILLSIVFHLALSDLKEEGFGIIGAEIVNNVGSIFIDTLFFFIFVGFFGFAYKKLFD